MPEIVQADEGRPVGLTVLNRLPAIMTLRPASNNLRIVSAGNTTVVEFGTRQRSFGIRAVYFLLIGLWIGGLWIGVA